MKNSRRRAVKMLVSAVPAIAVSRAFGQAANPAGAAATPSPTTLPPAPAHIPAPPGFGVAAGPCQPTLESLSANFKVPDWYRDAKFGIWAHWGPQCQPEMGDWYAMRMYQPGNPVYKFHVQKYGHPSQFGFKDVINEWKADKWKPEELIALYKRAGAKFFSSMANHHDNMDMFDSTYQPWNSTRIGPKKDIVGGWMKAVRAAGLHWAVSSHGDRAWDWMQVAQGSDPDGPMAGVHYDGLLSKADGKGKWWEGLDPQDLYAQYHLRGSYGWNLSPRVGGTGRGGAPVPAGITPPLDPIYIEKYFNRTVDLINKYQPDLIYFDDTIMPIWPSSNIGPRLAAYLYNTNMARNGGKLEALITGKNLTGVDAPWRQALLLDVERGVPGASEALPWQTDTCIGSWHYDKRIFDEHRYKTARQVVQLLIDIVSKNGCLQLSIPLKGDGTLDDDEVRILEGIAGWIAPNGEGIYATRPWKVYGEGPSTETSAQGPGARPGPVDVRPYTPEDFRFTVKGDTLYAFMMGWPEGGKAKLTTLREGSEHFPQRIGRVELLGAGNAPLTVTRDASGLLINLPEKKPNDFAYVFKIMPAK